MTKHEFYEKMAREEATKAIACEMTAQALVGASYNEMAKHFRQAEIHNKESRRYKELADKTKGSLV